MNEVLVSIKCMVFNHEPFLRQCLDGFVMQKTKFRYEAIVHDDCSTDNSAEIIKEYAAKYPDIIKPIFEIENQYSKGGGSVSRIMEPYLRGKYIAMCEGDDYWTDPYKLQKQIDFLESHPEYSLCFHNALEHWEKSKKKDSLFVKNINEERDFTGLEILRNWLIPTASVVFRRDILVSDLYERVKKEKRFLAGDNVLFLTAANYGKLHYLNNVMSVYRRHEGGMTSSSSFASEQRWLQHNLALKDIFGKKYACIKDFAFRSYMEILKISIKEKNILYIFVLIFKMFVFYPRQTLRYVVKHISLLF